MFVQQFDGSAQVIRLDGLLRQEHVRRVEVLPRRQPAGDSLTPLPQNAGQAQGKDRVEEDEGRREGRAPPTPAPDAARQTDGTGEDRLVGEETPEVIGQLLGRGVTAARFLLEAFQTDSLEVPRDAGIEQAGGYDLRIEHLIDDHLEGVALERRPRRQQVIEDAAQSKDIARRAHLSEAAAGLFRRQEIGGTEHLARHGQARLAVQAFGQAKIGDARLVVAVNHHVGGLEVAVQNALRMRIVYRLGGQPYVARGLSGRQSAIAHELSQVLAFDIIHREEVLAGVDADLVDGHDVRMLQNRGGRGFGLKAPHGGLRGKLAPEHQLQRDEPGQAKLPGLVHHPHASAPELLEEFVVAETTVRGAGLGKWSFSVRFRGGAGWGLLRWFRGEQPQQALGADPSRGVRGQDLTAVRADNGFAHFALCVRRHCLSEAKTPNGSSFP